MLKRVKAFFVQPKAVLQSLLPSPRPTHVFEVEFETGRPDYRFQWHVKAASENDARARASAVHAGMRVKEVRVYRELREDER